MSISLKVKQYIGNISNVSKSNKYDIFGVLFTLRIRYEYTKTQYNEGARYANLKRNT